MMLIETSENISNTMLDLQVTKNANIYFRNLLSLEPLGTNIKITVYEPESTRAHLRVDYCYINEELATDLVINMDNYKIFIEHNSIKALTPSTIDYSNDDLDAQLIIKAPNLKGPAPLAHTTLEDKINYLLDTEVNPSLAQHGGQINMVKVENHVLYLKFSGGCHGCAHSKVTLKHGVENIIKNNFPEIHEIQDITEHEQGKNPYYK